MDIELTETERKILAATLERNMISGAELARYAGTSNWQALADAVKKLMSERLVEVSGNIFDANDFPYATIGVVPSSKRYVHEVLSK